MDTSSEPSSIECLDKGYVMLVSYGPVDLSITQHSDSNVTMLEQNILRSARVSYRNDLKPFNMSANISLLEYLISMRHTSPFEMVEFVFEIKLPLATAVHFLRHRTANVNMVSFRYTEPEKEDFYIPEFRLQDSDRRQCSSSNQPEKEVKQQIEQIQEQMNQSLESLFQNYSKLMDLNVAREVARFYLPNSTYTRMYWKIDLHNLMHFLSLRTASDAQYETRVYANAISDLITPLVPNVMALFKKHRTESLCFSADEIKILKDLIHVKEIRDNTDIINEKTKDMSKRKKDAFIEKINKITEQS